MLCCFVHACGACALTRGCDPQLLRACVSSWRQDVSNKMFVTFVFTKAAKTLTFRGEPTFVLKPCRYKRR